MQNAYASRSGLTRRHFLLGLAGVVTAAAAALPLPRGTAGEARLREYSLTAMNSRVALLGDIRPPMPAWAYNSQAPGPEIRVRQGERLRVVVTNKLDESTTVHWHGIRLPNAMDGVPHLTQEPIAAGERFVYEFPLPDAGTFWYHPHIRSFEQVGRGLAGPLIVEEVDSIRVDRDVVWLLDDWRLTHDGTIDESFGDMHDVSHAGRLGNTVTINGRLPEDFTLRRGERVRLRLINGANARIFGLDFRDHDVRIIAIDGQPVTPHSPEHGRVVVAPSMRVDLVLDAVGEPGRSYTVVDDFYQRLPYELIKLQYETQPLREQPLDSPIALPANPLPEPDLKQAEVHAVRLAGGMMGRLDGATLDGKPVRMMEMMRAGKAWAINDVVASGHAQAPLLTLERNRSYVLRLLNDTAWHHPIHLHGHSFRVLSRDGRPTRYHEWQDSVLVNPRETVEIAFVADNPGNWMFHCHILEHQIGGMMSVIRVA